MAATRVILMLATLVMVMLDSSYLGVKAVGVFGDPHFTGWDGVHFDFTGEPNSIYCMLSDVNLHINMKLGGGGGENRTWITSLGVLFGTHRLVLFATEGADVSHRGSFLRGIKLDGARIRLLPKDHYTSKDGLVNIYYKGGGTGPLPYDTYIIRLKGVAEMAITASPEIPELRTPENAFFHLSLNMVKARLSPAVHGVLGQTYLNAVGRVQQGANYRTRWNSLLLVQQVDGPNGDGYLDGSPPDYLSSHLLHSDCRYSRFDANRNSPTGSSLVQVSSGYSRKVLLHSLRVDA